MISAAIYARVSSARQKKDQTIGSQTAALREHATQNRLEVPPEWVFEDEGHSGATLVRPGLEALRDLAAQGCLDVVLVYSPDRLARKFAYQALLIEEFARTGVRVEFINNGARGDTPEDQLLVQFQGMFAEYEKAQLMERYRRGKVHRARTGSVNVLSGAPFGYRYLRKGDHAGAAYEILEDEAPLIAELFRRYADDGATIADLARWLTGQGVPTRTGKHRWDRSVVCGMLHNPAYAGRAVFGKTMAIQEPAGLNRIARLQGRSVPRAARTVGRPSEEWTEISVPAAGFGRLLGMRIRLLPHLHEDHEQDDLLLPVPRLGRLPLRGRPGLPQPAGPRRLPRHRCMGTHHRPARRPGADPVRDQQASASRPHLQPGHQPTQATGRRPRQGHRIDHRHDRGVLRAADNHR